MKVLNTSEVAMVSGAGFMSNMRSGTGFFSSIKVPVNFLNWISVGVAGGALTMKNPVISVLNLNIGSNVSNNP